MSEGPVKYSEDLRRILALPRLTWEPGQAEILAENWTRELLNAEGLKHWLAVKRLPAGAQAAEFARYGRGRAQGGEGCPIALNTVQAQALYGAHLASGLFLGAPVGAGKTLVTRALAVIFGAERPLLLIPAALKNQTIAAFSAFDRFWKKPINPLTIETYSKIGLVQHCGRLCDCVACRHDESEQQTGLALRPDLIICDEAASVRNASAAVSKRVARYMSRHPETIYCGMTGTFLRKSLRDIYRSLIWALKMSAPVPLHYLAQQEWCEALDAAPRDDLRRPVGALANFCAPGEAHDLDGVRRAVQRRIAETPGVVISDQQSCETPVILRCIKAPEDPILDTAFAQFRATESTPDGWPLSDPLSVLRHGTEIGCGFYYRWDPRPPIEWLDARKAWACLVRETIRDSQQSRKPIDTEKQVAIRCKNHPIYVAWKAVENAFVINTVAVPLTASVLGAAAKWLQGNTRALVWTQHRYVGQSLSAMTGVPYFGAEGKTIGGLHIDRADPENNAILSIHANFKGRNLQAYSRNLIVGPEHSAERWEQMIGRTSRQGQTEPVYLDVLISCAENLQALEKAIAESEYVQPMGGHTQKLLLARFDWSIFAAESITQDPNHSAFCRWNRGQ